MVDSIAGITRSLDLPRENIRDFTKKIEAGHYCDSANRDLTPPDLKELQLSQGINVEVSALSAYFLNEIWALYAHYVDNDPLFATLSFNSIYVNNKARTLGLWSKMKIESLFRDGLQVELDPNILHQRIRIAEQEKTQQIFTTESLFEQMYKLALKVVYDWEEQNVGMFKMEKVDDDPNMAAFLRFFVLAPHVSLRKTTPANHILPGFNTALRVMFSLINLAKQLDPNNPTAILNHPKTRSLLIQLAGTSIHAIVSAQDILSNPWAGSASSLDFDSSKFELGTDNKGQFPMIKPDALEAILNRTKKLLCYFAQHQHAREIMSENGTFGIFDEIQLHDTYDPENPVESFNRIGRGHMPVTTSCPALYARAESGNHMIDQLWKHVLKLHETYVPTHSI